MDIGKISIGENPPYDVNVIVEVPMGADPVKYEMDKPSGALFVDRFLHTAMRYPGNYGFVPHTLANDGDPLDVLIVGRIPVVPGGVLRCRPLGILFMVDEQGEDEKLLCVPHDDLHPFYSGVTSYRDLPRVLLDQIAHFFAHYKDLEEGKWVKLKRWGEVAEAAEIVRQAIERARNAG